VKAQASRRQRLTQLQLAFGNALFAARAPASLVFPNLVVPVAIRYDRFTSTPAVRD
jgi:hypothetical protein